MKTRSMLHLVEPGNRIAAAHSPRVASGGQYHAHRRFGSPFQLAPFELAMCGGPERRNEVRSHAMHQHLSFGIAQARVKLQHLRPPVRHHKTGVEKTTE